MISRDVVDHRFRRHFAPSHGRIIRLFDRSGLFNRPQNRDASRKELRAVTYHGPLVRRGDIGATRVVGPIDEPVVPRRGRNGCHQIYALA
jgi:hypothetical protein